MTIIVLVFSILVQHSIYLPDDITQICSLWTVDYQICENNQCIILNSILGDRLCSLIFYFIDFYTYPSYFESQVDFIFFGK